MNGQNRGPRKPVNQDSEFDDTPRDVLLLERTCPAIKATDVFCRSVAGSDQADELLGHLWSILWPGRERRAQNECDG